MQMTESEIVRSYNQADKKREQIKILSELNCCEKSVIRQILRDNGIQVAEPGNRYTKNKESKPEPKQPEPEKLTVPESVVSFVEMEIRKIDREIADNEAQMELFSTAIKRLYEQKAELLLFQNNIQRRTEN